MAIQERLYEHLEQIVRDRNPYYSSQGHFYVQQYIQAELGRWGEVKTHNFSLRGTIHHNYILDLVPESPGDRQRPPIILGAHYDTVPGSPGADDNASGVAALLELARAFSANPCRYPLRLIAFDMEEYGMIGSSAYAEEMKQQTQPIRLMISLEMLGYCTQEPNSQTYPPGLQAFYPDRGNFIAAVANLPAVFDARHLCRTLRRQQTPSEWLAVPNRGKLVPASRLSDNAPFWDCGYRAMMLTDTSFLRNPHYHQASDTIDTLDLNFLAGICQGLVAAMQAIA